MTEKEHRGISEARANACEIVAWRFLARLPEREAVDYCLYEIQGNEALEAAVAISTDAAECTYDDEAAGEAADELSPLLGVLATDHQHSNVGISMGMTNGTVHPSSGGFRANTAAAKRSQLISAIPKLTMTDVDTEEPSLHKALGRDGRHPGESFKDLNALEIAAIANAKRFLSQYIVQKIITGLWNGEIIFWDSVSAHATRAPRYYNPRTADPYSRLRVPKYLKAWEILFFMSFLGLYYSVVVTRSPNEIPTIEVVFYLWLVAFLWDEFQEWADAGIFYLADFWNLFDMTMIAIGIVFAILRENSPLRWPCFHQEPTSHTLLTYYIKIQGVIGITYALKETTDTAFDILSLEALLVIPRICSFLSLSPYWGTLIPCLKEMGRDFVKFMILVVIIYVGFLTTFVCIAPDTFDVGKMTWAITKIFYGNTSIGFGIMSQIDERFGPPLMILFITLSSILLTGSLTGMLSNSFSRVMAQSREEYLYVYSVYVLEASTSSRLTHFLPPFNLIALVFFRPWRIVFPKDDRFRHSRVVVLKITHAPVVGIIMLYEWVLRRIKGIHYSTSEKSANAAANDDLEEWAGFSGNRTRSNSEAPRYRTHAIGVNSSNKPYVRGRNSGSVHRPAIISPRRRGYSASLHATDWRPSSAGRYFTGGTRGRRNSHGYDDQEVGGPSNAELLAKVDKLTSLVMAMEERQRRMENGNTQFPPL